MDVEDARTIGARARRIRRRRGLSLDVVAGLAGIRKQYLSMLERGLWGFNRRGLIEDLANALGCSVVDLTGQPYLPPDRTSAEALATLPGIREVVYDIAVDDAPEVQSRPVEQLAVAVRRANEFRDAGHYGPAGRGLGTLLAELHAHTAAGGSDVRRAALPVLVEACHVAAAVAEVVGHEDLALACAVREAEAAEALGDDPALASLSAYSLGQTWLKVGARRKAATTLANAVEASSSADPHAENTAAAEMAGMVQLGSALLGARTGDRDAVTAHLSEAASLAERTGERNTQLQHFGPVNVALWKVALAVDLGDGPAAADAVEAHPIPVELLGSPLRSANLSLDLARGWAQAGGDRDAQAIRALDAADRSAPTMVRNHPLARELLDDLYGRARRPLWELDSLRHRFGVGGQGPRSVDN
ncbi:MAG TPA: helix-turn-helix transcriptional regulator [Pseudonocardiaceae bacterium]|nr:helix-turn-helix transcriptional regulator [Pseudonocardiaceae bacterium]